jgi:hypothetical protein
MMAHGGRNMQTQLKDETYIRLITIGAFVGLFYVYDRMHGRRIKNK